MATACDYFYLFGGSEPKLNEIGAFFSICVRQVSPEFIQLIFYSQTHITLLNWWFTLRTRYNWTRVTPPVIHSKQLK